MKINYLPASYPLNCESWASDCPTQSAVRRGGSQAMGANGFLPDGPRFFSFEPPDRARFLPSAAAEMHAAPAWTDILITGGKTKNERGGSVMA
jgi:hypothetical protein